jgi:TctA family transporter
MPPKTGATWTAAADQSSSHCHVSVWQPVFRGNTFVWREDSSVPQGAGHPKRIIPSALRGSAVGSILGLLPGGGPGVAQSAAYMLDKKSSKYKREIVQGFLSHGNFATFMDRPIDGTLPGLIGLIIAWQIVASLFQRRRRPIASRAGPT